MRCMQVSTLASDEASFTRKPSFVYMIMSPSSSAFAWVPRQFCAYVVLFTEGSLKGKVDTLGCSLVLSALPEGPNWSLVLDVADSDMMRNV